MIEKKNVPLVHPVEITEQHWGDETMPLVSISCITYNHEKFIREALEGFLMQQTTFPVEILVHDDASADRTSEIIREYQSRFSNFIFPIIQDENQYSKGVRGMSRTFNYPRARGKYIAMCEGDDYWTDPLKLQKQVKFLEAHPEYSAAAHQALVIFDNESGKEPSLFREHTITDIETRHLLDSRLFHTASLVFRSEIVKKNSLPMGITAGDRALFFLLATRGKIYYSDEVMCCYRKHTGGMSNWVTTEMLEKDLNIVPWISKINPTFPTHQYYRFLHVVALRYPKSLSILKIIKHSLLYIYHSFFIKPFNFKHIYGFITREIPTFFTKIRHTE